MLLGLPCDRSAGAMNVIVSDFPTPGADALCDLQYDSRSIVAAETAADWLRQGFRITIGWG